MNFELKKNKNDLSMAELLTLPDDFIELLTLNQLINPINTDISLFVSQNFNSDWYSKKEYQEAHKLCVAFLKKYQSVPTLKFLESAFNNERYEKLNHELKSLIKNLSDIDYIDYDLKFLQDALVEHIKERALYFALFNNIQEIQENHDIKQFLPRFEEIVKLELNNDIGVEYFSNIDAHIQKLLSPEIVVSTGYDSLDRIMYGGIPVDDTCLFLFMAKPGLGKSMFMTNIAGNLIKQNKNVLVISLEMSEHLYSKRFDSIFTNININRLKDATEGLAKQIKNIHLSCPKSKLRIKSFPTGTCTTAHIKQYIKKLKELYAFIPDVIIVDYLNITKPNNSADANSLYTKGKAVAEELRALSGELKEIVGKCVPVFSAVQSNKSASGGYATDDIDIENSAESSGIPATADIYLAIFQKEGDREEGKIWLKVIKNRYGGKVGETIPYSVNYDTLKIEDYDETTENNENQDLIVAATQKVNKKEIKVKNKMDELMGD